MTSCRASRDKAASLGGTLGREALILVYSDHVPGADSEGLPELPSPRGHDHCFFPFHHALYFSQASGYLGVLAQVMPLY